ncbi:MAG: hypothetical protein HND27_06165 [Bacteroidetes bacterium]|nr:hypothetical protein [Bacteroidota bacterium]MBV6459951.1 hypothetical protein [Flavobacteriales bacterium]WKZ76404.1 MAG: hypothetical protein QY303_05780 [Vicingaceae bacterium]MCL4816325.1 hypothetical protein [Flavobacteriales bacterium]NOG95347.1 hypothetical protein [Bacteroidota bacterium]
MKHLFLIIALSFVSSGFAQTSEVWNQKDSKGLKQGKWKKHYDTGEVYWIGEFKNDKPINQFIYYFKSGAVLLEVTHFPNAISRATFYYETGEVAAAGKYYKQQRDSIWVHYYPKGNKMSQEKYINGKRYGTSTDYYQNGNVLREQEWENNLEHGLTKVYYENGKLKEQKRYKMGSLEGLCSLYESNGNMYMQGSYLKDVKHGTWYTYKNGKQNKTMEYEYGKCKGCDEIVPLDEPIEKITDQDIIDEFYKKYGNLIGK